MKKLLLAFVTVFSILTCFSQSSFKERRVVSVLEQQVIFLNGGLRASFGGKSREYFEIKLPPNTVEWYYTITTFEGEKTDIDLNLVPQLTRALDPTGFTSIAISAILAPTGSRTCDVYIMDWPNTQAFIKKVDNNGGTYYFNRSAKRENFREGVVQIKDAVAGSWFLGIKNPSSSTGIGIALEVAAIVEEPAENVDKAILYGNMGWKAFEEGEIDKCIELSKKALALYKALGYVKGNLGLCYLIKNDEATATDYYVDALSDFKKMKEKVYARDQIKAMLDDITNATIKYSQLKQSQFIKELLLSEINQMASN